MSRGSLLRGPTSAIGGGGGSAEDWHVVGSGGGEPAFNTDWGNTPGDTACSFRLVGDYVEVEGFAIQGGGDIDDTHIFVLPSGYRPDVTTKRVTEMFTAGGLAIGEVIIGPGGGVSVFVPSFTGVLGARIAARFPLNAPPTA